MLLLELRLNDKLGLLDLQRISDEREFAYITCVCTRFLEVAYARILRVRLGRVAISRGDGRRGPGQSEGSDVEDLPKQDSSLRSSNTPIFHEYKKSIVL